MGGWQDSPAMHSDEHAFHPAAGRLVVCPCCNNLTCRVLCGICRGLGFVTLRDRNRQDALRPFAYPEAAVQPAALA
jgi:hypothetical protein